MTTMPTETTVAEKPVSGAARMQIANREAEVRAGTPLKTWTPAPLRPPPHPRQVELADEAKAIREQAEQAAARADHLDVQARLTGQKIAGLVREKTELLDRLSVIEGRDFKAQRESSRQTIHRYYGNPRLSAPEREGLNAAVMLLAWSPLLEKEIPLIKKALQNRVEKIDEELAGITATK